MLPIFSRIPGTFGEDPATVSALVGASVEGFQGVQLGRDSVLAVTRHFPGDGPVRSGLDPQHD